MIYNLCSDVNVDRAEYDSRSTWLNELFKYWQVAEYKANSLKNNFKFGSVLKSTAFPNYHNITKGNVGDVVA